MRTNPITAVERRRIKNVIRCNQLAYIRDYNGLTQSQLAKIVGLSKNMISEYECNGSLPNVLTAIKIAETLHVSVYDIWWEE